MKKSKNNRQEKKQNPPAVILQVNRSELASSTDWQKSKSFFDIARPEDDILRNHGYNIKIYRSLLNDEQVKACFLNQRIAGVIAAPWEVQPVSDSHQDIEIADFVTQNLENLSFNEICRKMLYANWYGFQAGEIMWEVEDNHIIIKDIKVRNIERFAFKPSGELLLIKSFSDKEIMPERKFWVIKNSGDNDDEIYGIGLGHICYWPVYLKRNGLKFWAVLVEKFAVPTAVGKYSINASPEQIRDVLEALDSIATESAIAVPEGTAVELLESAKSSGGDHEKFCCYLDKIIAKAILGQDGTSQNGAYAGTAEVQENVKDLVLKSDSDLLCESFNEVIKWLVAYNWPEAIAPKIVRRFEQSENLKDEAVIYQTMRNVGYRPSLQMVQDKFGGEWEQVEASPNHQPTAEFSERKEVDPVSQLVDDLAEDWEVVMSPILNPVNELLEKSKNFAELEEKLLNIYPQMDTEKLQELIAEANFKARIAGKIGVKK